MSIHEEVGYTPGHVVGHSDYEEDVRHMRHCIQLALDEDSEKKGGPPSTKPRIENTETDSLVGFNKNSIE
tara:strand:+ start:749 stop:958 length:210 start_codon:yes stop_codon:yes gene_type:complete